MNIKIKAIPQSAFVIIEYIKEDDRISLSRKARISEVFACGFTDALRRFKTRKKVDRLPNNTTIIRMDESNAVFYPKDV